MKITKRFWMYFLFGVVIGLIVGLMKTEVATWLIVGAILGFLVALFLEIRKNMVPEKVIWLGFFMLFPIMFFKGYLEGTFWYDVFGILAVIGAFIIIVNFTKVLRKKKRK